MSCDMRVFIDQPTESNPSGNPSSQRDDRWFGGPKRRDLPQGPVRPVHVVMVGVLDQHRPQLPTSEDERPI
jgi:hypothetical protein